MQGTRFTMPFHFGGTLAANQTVCFAMPVNASLESISFSASNAAASTLKVGTVADDDGYITAYAVGQSNVPVVKAAGDFNGALVTVGLRPRLLKGGDVLLTLDFDGAAGTAGANVTVVLAFSEG